MRAVYRFLRTRGGRTSFAIVAVQLQPSSTWIVRLDAVALKDSAYRYTGYFDTALREGVEIAAREHERRGGEPRLVEIVELGETAIDSGADAVRCAAALATWKALGHAESDANVVFDQEQGEWRVTFQHSSEQSQRDDQRDNQ